MRGGLVCSPRTTMKLRLLFPASSLALGLLVSGCHPDASRVLANKRIAQVPETATAAAVVAPKPAPFAAPPVLSGTLDVAALAAKVKPCVVNVTTVHASKDALFGEEGQKASRALGSGFIVDPKGLVVTNAHVVDGA